jgi:hypothetical protein
MASCSNLSVSQSGTYNISSCSSLNAVLETPYFVETVSSSSGQVEPFLVIPLSANSNAITQFGLTITYSIAGGSSITATLPLTDQPSVSDTCTGTPSIISIVNPNGQLTTSTITSTEISIHMCPTVSNITLYNIYIAVEPNTVVTAVTVSIST